MPENKSRHTTNESDENIDQYDAILRALEEGTIITVNDNTPNSAGLGEFTVEFSKDNNTRVSLFDGRRYHEIKRIGDDIVIGETTEQELKRTKTVETIEVLGINGN